MLNKIETKVKDCFLFKLERFTDDRGFFQECFKYENYEPFLDFGMSFNWKQMNWSNNKKHVLRGIHVAPYGKLVTCVSGKIWDCVVDLRAASETFLQVYSVELSQEQPQQIFVPPGCGHAFVSLEDCTSVVYLQTQEYSLNKEVTLNHKEPFLKIEWPGSNHILSPRDKNGMSLQDVLNYRFFQNRV